MRGVILTNLDEQRQKLTIDGFTKANTPHKYTDAMALCRLARCSAVLVMLQSGNKALAAIRFNAANGGIGCSRRMSYSSISSTPNMTPYNSVPLTPRVSRHCLYSAIWHAILDNFRPVSVWGTDLVIFYFITNGTFGEAWTHYSWLQFSGMMVRLRDVFSLECSFQFHSRIRLDDGAVHNITYSMQKHQQ